LVKFVTRDEINTVAHFDLHIDSIEKIHKTITGRDSSYELEVDPISTALKNKVEKLTIHSRTNNVVELVSYTKLTELKVVGDAQLSKMTVSVRKVEIIESTEEINFTGFYYNGAYLESLIINSSKEVNLTRMSLNRIKFLKIESLHVILSESIHSENLANCEIISEIVQITASYETFKKLTLTNIKDLKFMVKESNELDFSKFNELSTMKKLELQFDQPRQTNFVELFWRNFVKQPVKTLDLFDKLQNLEQVVIKTDKKCAELKLPINVNRSVRKRAVFSAVLETEEKTVTCHDLNGSLTITVA